MKQTGHTSDSALKDSIWIQWIRWQSLFAYHLDQRIRHNQQEYQLLLFLQLLHLRLYVPLVFGHMSYILALENVLRMDGYLVRD
jgi:hypothetical protein